MSNPSLEALVEELGVKVVTRKDALLELDALLPSFDARFGLKTMDEVDRAIRDGHLPCCDLVEKWIDATSLLSVST